LNSNSDKAINIPVTIKNGAVIFPDEFDLNTLKKEFRTEIILEDSHFADKNYFDSLARQTVVELLPADSRLLVNISLKNPVSEELAKFIISGEGPKGADGGFIEAFLRQSQRLKLRGKKKALLLPCRVEIPALPGQRATSINHANTLISEAFEPWRISHTSNVYFKVYAREESGGEWLSLDTLRKQAEARERKRTEKPALPDNLFDDQVT
jgi:hypothetical protein